MTLNPGGLVGLIVSLLLLLVALSLLGLRVAARAWKRRFQLHLSAAAPRLRAARDTLRNMERAARTFPPEGSSLYGPSLATLRQALEQAQIQVRELSAEQSALHRAMPEEPSSLLRALAFRLVEEPLHLLRVSLQARSLRTSAGALEQRLELAGRQLDSLHEVPRTVAARSTQARREIDRLAGLCASLRAAGLHGVDLDRVEGVVRQLDGALLQLPDRFRRGGELGRGALDGDMLLTPGLEPVAEEEEDPAQVTPASTEQAWQTLEQMTTPLRLCADQLDSWRHALGRLEVAQSEVEPLFREVARSMSDAARAAALPVDWGQDENLLKDLSEARARLDRPSAARSTDELTRDMEAADGLQAELRALSMRVEQAVGQRARLIELLGSPELVARPDWVEEARVLQAQVAPYSVDNWAAELGAHDLADDAQRLYRLRKQWSQVDPSERVPASDVAGWVTELQHLVGAITSLPARLDHVARRLARLQKEEQAARAQLQSAVSALDLLAQSLRETRPPLPALLEEKRKGLERLQSEGSTLLAELEMPGAGLVGEKVQRQRQWCRACTDPLHSVASLLAGDARQARQQLGEALQELQDIAPLDQDDAIRLAARMLRQAGSSAALTSGPQASTLTPDVASLAASCGQILEERARLEHALQALHSQVARPLERILRTCHEARQAAQSRLPQLLAFKQQVESAWPPVACDTRRVDERLDAARRGEARLKHGAHTVSDVRQALDEIAGDYRQALREMDHLQATVGEELPAIRDAATQIERWRARLKAYRDRRGVDPVVAQAVDARLAELERGLDDLRRLWSGAPPAAGRARRELESLYSRLHIDVPVSGRAPLRLREVERGEG